jgi:hypothetical protein
MRTLPIAFAVVTGLCSFAPGLLNKYALVFTGVKAGTFKVYIDNLRIRHGDGSVSSLWSDGKDTRFPRNLACPVGFRYVTLRAVLRTSIATGNGRSFQSVPESR